eukprot:Lankesteria_metandrocarpae@DN6105_c0_g1_i1.p1
MTKKHLLPQFHQLPPCHNHEIENFNGCHQETGGAPECTAQLSETFENGDVVLICSEGKQGGARVLAVNKWSYTKFLCATLRKISESQYEVILSTKLRGERIIHALNEGGIAQQAPSIPANLSRIIHLTVEDGRLRCNVHNMDKKKDAKAKMPQRQKLPTFSGETLVATFMRPSEDAAGVNQIRSSSCTKDVDNTGGV